MSHSFIVCSREQKPYMVQLYNDKIVGEIHRNHKGLKDLDAAVVRVCVTAHYNCQSIRLCTTTSPSPGTAKANIKVLDPSYRVSSYYYSCLAITVLVCVFGSRTH